MSRKLVLSFIYVGSLMLFGCQGMDPTPISVDQTPPNFSALSNNIICRFATTSEGYWDTRPEYQGHVQEAKRRALSCGLGETSIAQTNSVTKNLSSESIAYTKKDAPDEFVPNESDTKLPTITIASAITTGAQLSLIHI